MCQINLSLALGLYQYKNHLVPLQHQDARLALFDEYFRQHYLNNQQHEPTILFDKNQISNIHEEPISRLNWLKRETRLNSQSNKRMLCFFHAVNCFG